MAYRTKVEVRTNGKVYKPGSILPADMSKIDLDFLKSKKFIEVVEVSAAVAGADEDDEDDDPGDGMFDELNVGEYKSTEEVRKIRKKGDLYKYALSIGLDLGDDYEDKKVADLADEIINFQEEKEAAGEDE